MATNQATTATTEDAEARQRVALEAIGELDSLIHLLNDERKDQTIDCDFEFLLRMTLSRMSALSHVLYGFIDGEQRDLAGIHSIVYGFGAPAFPRHHAEREQVGDITVPGPAGREDQHRRQARAAGDSRRAGDGAQPHRAAARSRR